MGEMDAGDVLEVIFKYEPYQQPDVGQSAEKEDEEGGGFFGLHKHVEVAQQPGIVGVSHKESTNQSYQPWLLPYKRYVFVKCSHISQLQSLPIQRNKKNT